MTNNPTTALIEHRLHDARLWCASRLSQNPQHSLRSPELAPDGSKADYWFLGWTPEQRWAALDTLTAKRAALLRGLPVEIDVENATGHVVAFLPDLSLSDGAAEVESQGFFNVHNLPAWDTWIAYVQEPGQRLQIVPLRADRRHIYLLAWVPLQWLDRVNEAIEVNPEECLLWASDLGAPTLRHPAI